MRYMSMGLPRIHSSKLYEHPCRPGSPVVLPGPAVGPASGPSGREGYRRADDRSDVPVPRPTRARGAREGAGCQGRPSHGEDRLADVATRTPIPRPENRAPPGSESATGLRNPHRHLTCCDSQKRIKFPDEAAVRESGVASVQTTSTRETPFSSCQMSRERHKRMRPRRLADLLQGPALEPDDSRWAAATGFACGCRSCSTQTMVLQVTLFSQVRMARPAGARSRAGRYEIVLGPDDGPG